MPVCSTVRVLILYGKGFSQLDCSKILKNYQLWPKFLLNAVTLCSTHHSYRHVTGLHYKRSNVSDVCYESILSPLTSYLSFFFHLRLLNFWSMNIACRNSDCNSQRTGSVCLTKTNLLKLLRENIDVHYASHVQYEHLHIHWANCGFECSLCTNICTNILKLLRHISVLIHNLQGVYSCGS